MVKQNKPLEYDARKTARLSGVVIGPCQKKIISEVKVLDSGKLLLVLKSGGEDSYQYIYREAGGVYWEKDLKGFISTEPKKWSYSEWFSHIVDVAGQIDIDLKLSSTTDWNEVPEKEKEQILKEHTI